MQTVYFERTLSTWHRNFSLGMTPFGLALVVIGLDLVLSLIWLTLIGVVLLFGGATVVMQPPGWAKPRWLRIAEAGGEFRVMQSRRMLSQTADVVSFLAFCVTFVTVALAHSPGDLLVGLIFGLSSLLNYLSSRQRDLSKRLSSKTQDNAAPRSRR